jgi:hypothetical protein
MDTDNVVPIKPEPAASSVADTRAVKVGKHVRKHGKKYVAGSLLAILIAILQGWQALCPSIGALLGKDLRCAQTAPIAKFGETKLEEVKDEAK